MKHTASLYRKWAKPMLVRFGADWALMRVRGRLQMCPAQIEPKRAS